MANKTIPQLPLQTGVTDLDLFAIVDSGETITSSIKRSEFMSGATNTTFQNITLSTDSIIYSPPPTGISWGGFIVTDPTNPGTVDKGNNTVSIANHGSSLTSISNGTTAIGNTSIALTNTAGSVSIANAFATVNGQRSVVVGGSNTSIVGGGSFAASSYVSEINGSNSVMISAPYGHDVDGTFSTSIANNQVNKAISGNYNTAISNNEGNLTTTGVNCGMYNSKDSNITGSTEYTVMLGCSGRTATSDFTTYVETLEAFDGIVMTDYANLNFADDSAAATGNVPLGGIYHNAGAMRIRIT